LNKFNTKGITPIWAAAERGHLDIVKMLHEDFNFSLSENYTSAGAPGFAAAQGGQLEVIKYLLKKDPRSFNTPNISPSTELKHFLDEQLQVYNFTEEQKEKVSARMHAAI